MPPAAQQVAPRRRFWLGVAVVALAGMALGMLAPWFLRQQVDNAITAAAVDAGATEAAVAVEQVGATGARLRDLVVALPGVRVTIPAVAVTYTPQSLWNKRLGAVLLHEPGVILDPVVMQLWQQAREAPALAPEEPADLSWSPEAQVPLEVLEIKDGRVTLRHEKAVALQLDLEAALWNEARALTFFAEGLGDAVRLGSTGRVARGTGDGEVHLDLRVAKTAPLVALARALSPALPPGVEFALAPMEVNLLVKLAAGLPERWALLGGLSGADVRQGDDRLVLGPVSLGFTGEDATPLAGHVAGHLRRVRYDGFTAAPARFGLAYNARAITADIDDLRWEYGEDASPSSGRSSVVVTAPPDVSRVALQSRHEEVIVATWPLDPFRAGALWHASTGGIKAALSPLRSPTYPFVELERTRLSLTPGPAETWRGELHTTLGFVLDAEGPLPHLAGSQGRVALTARGDGGARDARIDLELRAAPHDWKLSTPFGMARPRLQVGVKAGLEAGAMQLREGIASLAVEAVEDGPLSAAVRSLDVRFAPVAEQQGAPFAPGATWNLPAVAGWLDPGRSLLLGRDLSISHASWGGLSLAEVQAGLATNREQRVTGVTASLRGRGQLAAVPLRDLDGLVRVDLDGTGSFSLQAAAADSGRLLVEAMVEAPDSEGHRPVRTRFALSSLPPGAWLGRAVPALQEVRLGGNLTGEATATLAPDFSDGDLAGEIALLNGAISRTDDSLQLAGVNVVATLGGTLLTPTAEATLEAAQVIAGEVTGTDLTAHLQLRRDGVIALEGAALHVAGGRILVEPSTFDPDTLDTTVTLALENIELAEVAPLIPQFEGEVEGRVEGRIPVRIAGGVLSLGEGSLRFVAGEEGRLAYPGAESMLTGGMEPGSLQYQQLSKVEAAMQNLRLADFTITINDPEHPEAPVRVYLKGQGLGGNQQEIEVTLNLKGEFSEFLNAMLQFGLKFAQQP